VQHQKKQWRQQQHQQQRWQQWLNNNNNKTTKTKMKTTITITPTKSTTEKALKNKDVRLTANQAASCMQSSQQTHEKSATTTTMSLQHVMGPRGWQNGKTPASSIRPRCPTRYVVIYLHLVQYKLVATVRSTAKWPARTFWLSPICTAYHLYCTRFFWYSIRKWKPTRARKMVLGPSHARKIGLLALRTLV